MSQPSANDRWIAIQVEMRAVDDLISRLAMGQDSAAYGGPYDYCRQRDQITDRIDNDLRAAYSATQALRFRLEAFHEGAGAGSQGRAG